MSPAKFLVLNLFKYRFVFNFFIGNIRAKSSDIGMLFDLPWLEKFDVCRRPKTGNVCFSFELYAQGSIRFAPFTGLFLNGPSPIKLVVTVQNVIPNMNEHRFRSCFDSKNFFSEESMLLAPNRGIWAFNMCDDLPFKCPSDCIRCPMNLWTFGHDS